MNGAVTTATLYVCSRCGRVSHVEGTVQPQQVIRETCPALFREGMAIQTILDHAWKSVLVVVPYA